MMNTFICIVSDKFIDKNRKIILKTSYGHSFRYMTSIRIRPNYTEKTAWSLS